MYNLSDLDIDRNDRYERMLAEAAEDHFCAGLAPAQSWQSRLCEQIGHGLVSAGRRMESYSLRRQPARA